MNKAFQEIFGPIRAEEDLKDRTSAFLAEQTRSYGKTPAKRHRYPAYAAACACLLMLLLLGGRWLYFTPTAAISIDINPSFELSVNRFDRVIAVTGFNEDGQALSNTLDVKYMNYAQAVEQILRHDSVAALLSGGEVMAITVAGPDGQLTKLLSGVETCTAGQGDIDCYSAQPEETAAAHEAGLSCGKYRAFLELQRLDPDITPEAVQGMTMREIRDRIERLSSEGGSGAPQPGGWGSGHHSNGNGHGGGWRHGWDK